MEFENLGGERIFRPGAESELAIRLDAEASLTTTYKPGRYRDREVINAILQALFAFYDTKVKKFIPQIASRDFMEFVLDQYDRATRVNDKDKKNGLMPVERDRWNKLGPTFRRACKYIAECVCMLAPEGALKGDKNEILELTDKCWICAELMVQYSMLSDQTFMLFPDETTLKLWPERDQDWIVLSVADTAKYEGFQERIRLDTASRSSYIVESEGIYSVQRIQQYLDGPFETTCGFTITDALGFAQNLNRNAIVLDEGFDVPFVSEAQILSGLMAEYHLSLQDANNLLDGLCLRRDKMREEGRVVWKPKQEYRAFARPFFEFPHSSGTHFIWSREMAEECRIMLFTRFALKQIPPEWRNDSTTRALESYVSSITKKFEEVVNDSLSKIHICARRFESIIGHGTEHALEIPGSIGEIDTLGFWEEYGLLIIGEDKFVKPASEPTAFRDDVDKFIKKGNNYVDQLKRKTEWAIENAGAIGAALSTEEGFPKTVSVKRVAPALITYYPAFVSCFIEDVPCVSLCELLTKLNQVNSWPCAPVHEASRCLSSTMLVRSAAPERWARCRSMYLMSTHYRPLSAALDQLRLYPLGRLPASRQLRSVAQTESASRNSQPHRSA